MEKSPSSLSKVFIGPTTPGIFRIPGSSSSIAALYDYYCTPDEEGLVAGTVRSLNLPRYIKFDIHDVASTFKRFLSGVPGGILGSLALFDIFVSIQNQLNTDPELPTKKQAQIQSKLIALAMATVKSQYRRELICAVFGLLSMIGHAAEAGCHEGKHGESLPASNLMGCGSLGIVFGPLLIGDLLDSYNMRLANPYGGLILLPLSPPKSRKERVKSSTDSHDTVNLAAHMDKIKVVTGITEMLITHWRGVVIHMKTTQALRVIGKHRSLATGAKRRPSLRPSASESFALRTAPSWENSKFPCTNVAELSLEYVFWSYLY